MRGRLPEGPVVWAANHHSWWDGFMAASVLRADARTLAVLMDAENLQSFPFLRRAGAIGTSEPRMALSSLRRGDVLVIFPEAELRPTGPLGPTGAGAQWLARQAPAALVAVSVRVAMRGHQWPEIYVDFADVDPGSSLDEVLGARLALLDAQLMAADPREPLPGFDLVVRGRQSWDERISRVAALVKR